MLNGLYPIIIFNFSKLEPDLQAAVSDIPVVSSIVNKIGLPPIPVYLSTAITGLAINEEEKNIDIETVMETLTDGSDPVVNQKGVNNTIRISMEAVRDSIGLTLLGALVDRVFSKVTSKEYSITYLSGAITIFDGLVKSFSITQNASDDRYSITFELSISTSNKPTPKSPVPEIQRSGTGLVPLTPTTGQ